jgi:chromosome segregation ATPase
MSNLSNSSESSSNNPKSYYWKKRQDRCEYQRQYYLKKKKEILAKRQAKEEADPAATDARLAYNRAYYLKNRERILKERKERYRKLVQTKRSASGSEQQSEMKTKQSAKGEESTSSTTSPEEPLRGALTSLAKSVLSLRGEIARQRTHLAQLEARDRQITEVLTQIFEEPTSMDDIYMDGEVQNDAA